MPLRRGSLEGDSPDERELVSRLRVSGLISEATLQNALLRWNRSEETLPEHLLGSNVVEANSMRGMLKGLFEDAADVRERLAGSPSTYEVLRFLAEGAMGEVFEARDSKLGRKVAIKVLSRSETASPRARARFLNEARIGALLDHPQLCPVYDAGRSGDGDPFLVMKLIEGEALDVVVSRMREGELELSILERVEIVRQAADAIVSAHRAGVVHRDLKPGNLVLGPGNRICVMDWGLARAEQGFRKDTLSESSGLEANLLAGGLTREGTILGTPAYMAPEQAAGQVAGPPADVYGLGAVLYELLTLRPPFEASTVDDLLDLVRLQDPVPPRQVTRKVSRRIEAICLKCLEKEPGERYESAMDLATALGHALRSPRHGPRAPTIAAALGLIALLLMGALAWGARHRQQALDDLAAAEALLRGREHYGSSDYDSALVEFLERVAVVDVQPNPRTLFEKHLSAATAGDVESMHQLATMLETGNPGPRDLESALDWYRKAANAGHLPAMHDLARMHAEVDGVPRDLPTAVHWYRRSANAGTAASMHRLGILYSDGRGVARDPLEAIRWHRKAAAAGHDLSMLALGIGSLNGSEPNYAEAKEWFERAAATGSGVGMFSLGTLYERGLGVERDLETARNWYHQSAAAGYAKAMFNLGVHYAQGTGLEVDQDKANEWYEKAAEQGSPVAMFALGVRHHYGQGVPVDYAKAMSWYKASAGRGHSPAMVNLASLYATGLGVESNPSLALEWYRKARAAGEERAQETIDLLFRDHPDLR